MVSKELKMKPYTNKIIRASSSMYSSPKDKTLSNECLFGEEVKVIQREKKWLLCRLSSDNYLGWIHFDDIGDLPKENYKVSTIRTYIKALPDVKAPEIHYLSFESKIFVEEITDNWAKITLSQSHKQKFGYVFKNDIKPIDLYNENWVKTAESMINTPYRWGGRDTTGIDCSALLQLSLRSSGRMIPRDTNEQEKYKIFEEVEEKEIDRGTIVFWKGHVGIMTDNNNIIHANAFHMSTKIEPLNEVNKRINGKPVSFKNIMINF